MGMTITEKILARASNKNTVTSDDVVIANIDKVMVHDVSGPGVIKVFSEWEKKGITLDHIWDPDRVWISEDHFVPASDRISANNITLLTNWTKKYNIKKHYKYGLGQYGICHTLSHEEGLVLPGEIYVGGDSHTNTTGAIGALAVGLGHTDIAYVLMNGKIWFKVPETILFKIQGNKPEYIMAKDIILKIIGDIEGKEIDKAYIGSCTGAKLEDLRMAAKILKGKKVKIRTEVLPAAQSIYLKAIKEGLITIFMEAGAVVGPPTCGACCGAHMGVLAKDEICVSTTNRNFPGRMGHVESKTYLASPLVVAAAAITGKITDPRNEIS